MEKRLADANDLRESENYGESAKAYTDCLIDLVADNDITGLIHCLGGQSLIYKILYNETKSVIYSTLSLSFAKASYEVAEHSSDKLDGKIVAVAYRCYGGALLINGEPQEALHLFEKAIVISDPEDAERGYLNTSIGVIKYQLGESERGKQIINEALVDIRKGDTTSYHVRVWETGALIALTKIYSLEGSREKALETIQTAVDIATKYNLPIRKREAEEILKKISSGQTNFSI